MSAAVSVDGELCIGSGECVRLAPAAFVIDESLGVSVPLQGAGDVPLETLIAAARSCLTTAISVVAEDGEVLVASGGAA